MDEDDQIRLKEKLFISTISYPNLIICAHLSIVDCMLFFYFHLRMVLYVVLNSSHKFTVEQQRLVVCIDSKQLMDIDHMELK